MDNPSSLSLDEFRNRFPTEKSCLRFIFDVRWPDGFFCPSCGCAQYYDIAKRNLLQCKGCGCQTSVTAGTMMHRTRTSILNWFCVIYLIGCKRQQLTAKMLLEKMGMNYHTALRMLKKIDLEMKDSSIAQAIIESFVNHNTANGNKISNEKHRKRISNDVNGRNISEQNRMDISLTGYAVEDVVYEGPKNIFFRGRKLSDTSHVLIKTTVTEDPAFEDAARLFHEYEITKDLDIEEALSPVSHIMENGRPFLVFHDPGGLTLRTLAGSEKISLVSFLSIAINLSEAVEKLHQRNIIHKYINPDHVIIEKDSGKVFLTGFTLAAMIPREKLGLNNSTVFDGMLKYISPEQTGRMNRMIDYRSDFYSLGVIFYEILTGRLPFMAKDSAQFIHRHIAMEPIPLQEIHPEIPKALSLIVLKLLQKSPDDRYQTAQAMIEDFKECLSRYLKSGKIDDFPVGRYDEPQKFQVSSKLYGRQNEIELFMKLYEKVRLGKNQIMMISGSPGIGKTSLVREFHNTIADTNGYFISAKIEQYQQHRNSFNPLVVAFQDLVRQLSAEGKESLNNWKTKLMDALGSNAQTIIDVIPDLQMIIGKQPESEKLAFSQDQDRFRIVFKHFIGTFCRPESPLIIFLDNLQWADSDLFEFIYDIISDGDIGYIFLIGCYRKSEIKSSQVLKTVLRSLKKKSVGVNTIHLGPMGFESVATLITDTLKMGTEQIRNIANLVIRKTLGNPLIIKEFLTLLYHKNLIFYDKSSKRWDWRATDIAAIEPASDVVKRIISRVKKMPADCLLILQKAACIGSRFDLTILGMLENLPPKELLKRLYPAINEEIIFASNHLLLPEIIGQDSSSIKQYMEFIHDQVQEACYVMMDEKVRKQMHLKIGKLMLHKMEPESRKENSFDIVNQLNFAKDLICRGPERIRLCRLNLAACKKAKTLSSFELALHYIEISKELFQKDGWDKEYATALKIHVEAMEITYLNGLYSKTEEFFHEIIQHAKTIFDMARPYRLMIKTCLAQKQVERAFKLSLEILGLFGIKLSKDFKDINLSELDQKIRLSAENDKIAELIDLPQMRDPEKIALMQMLMDTATVLLDRKQFYFIQRGFIQFDLLLKYGHTCFSPLVLLSIAVIYCSFKGDVEIGYKYGIASLHLLKNNATREIRARSIFSFNNLIRPFKEHAWDTLGPLESAFQDSIEEGDFEFAGYSGVSICFIALLTGKKLSLVKEKLTFCRNAVEKIKQSGSHVLIETFYQFALSLMGEEENTYFSNWSDGIVEDTHLIENRPVLSCIYFIRAMNDYLFERYEQAYTNAEKGDNLLIKERILEPVIFIQYYDSLARLAKYPDVSISNQKRILTTIEKFLKKLEIAASHAPMNFSHIHHLIQAEMARVLGKDTEAIGQYKKAIHLAMKYRFANIEALSEELLAKFWISIGEEEYAGLHMKRAIRKYMEWGASCKAKALERNYDGLLNKQSENSGKSPVENYYWPHTISGGNSIDQLTMIKSAQLISSEIEINNILETFMKIVMENIGAQKGILLLESDGKMQIEAHAYTGKDDIFLRQPTSDDAQKDFPERIISHVIKTKKEIVLQNAAQEPNYMEDSYVKENRLKSALSIPILYKSELKGVLYLENNLIEGAFTDKHFELLTVLASQIAISIENALLFESLRKAEKKYRSVFENAVEGIFLINTKGRFISVNPSMARMFGYPSMEEMINAVGGIENLGFSDTKKKSMFLAILKRKKFAKNFEIQFYRKNGPPFWTAVNAWPVFDEKKELVVIEGLMSDITEQKMAMNALREREEHFRNENIRLRANMKNSYRFGNIIGKSEKMQEVYEKIMNAAASTANVIIYGESGSGKELVAKAIHDLSDRKDKNYIPVNCGAIADNLIESELFGYVRGAFTGAEKNKPGLLDAAHWGTLFLDEVGDINLNSQTKLLRAIEGYGYIPVGGSEVKKSDLRIISATSKNLYECINKGLMRQDFFYRIHVISINLPPLRERKDDLPFLIEYFLKIYDPDRKLPPITGKEIQMIYDYDWPGNVRELQNTLHRYVTTGRLDFLTGLPGKRGETVVYSSVKGSDGNFLSIDVAMANFERQYIVDVLEKCRWNRTKAASIIGIDRKSLYLKIKKIGV